MSYRLQWSISTAVVQLAWMAISLEKKYLKKPVHIITTDTMVENPIVSSWVNASLDSLNAAAKSNDLPIEAHLIKPSVEESFWVNLIGRGYPAPRAKFRWCTERLKIKPTNRFIEEKINDNGTCKGLRRSSRLEKRKTVQELYPHDTLANCLLYFEDWSNDEVWLFLKLK